MKPPSDVVHHRTDTRMRVDSVPFFVIDNKIPLSGVQSSDVFLAAFAQVTGPQ